MKKQLTARCAQSKIKLNKRRKTLEGDNCYEKEISCITYYDDRSCMLNAHCL